MSKFVTAPVRLLSLVTGALIACITASFLTAMEIPKPWAWGILVGASVALVLSLLMSFTMWRKYRIWCEAESRVVGDILYRDRVFLRCGRLRRVAYLFLTQDGIFLYLWDKRPFLETICRRVDVTIELGEEAHMLMLKFQDREPIYLAAPDWEEFLRESRLKDYTITPFTPNRKG